MRRASTWEKVVPAACVAVTFICSLALFLTRNERYIHSLPNLVRTYRSAAQIIIQILSTILATAQTVTICSLINFAARTRLFRTPVYIGDLSFWSAVSVPRFDRRLRIGPLALISVVLLLGLVLGAVWNGQLTPLLTKTQINDGEVMVPNMHSEVQYFMYPNADAGDGNGALMVYCSEEVIPDPRGPPFPDLQTCIVLNYSGNLISAASSASSNITSPPQRPRIDNSTWTYNGRSYGKGASALFGLTKANVRTTDDGFAYEESGYDIQASCHKQGSSSAPAIFPFHDQGSGGQLDVWTANSVRLEGHNVSIPTYTVAGPQFNYVNSKPFGWFAWTAQPYRGSYYLATAAQYDSWSIGPRNILCTITFDPWAYNVNVSTTDRLITVTPLHQLNDYDTSGNIREAVMLDIDLLSRISSASAGFTSLYSAISSNYAAARITYNLTGTTEENNDAAMEYAVADAVMAIADDLLMYQGMLAVGRGGNQSKAVEVERVFDAIKFGQAGYHIAQIIFTSLLVLVYLGEAFRTRHWRDMPDFNFLDTKALLLAVLTPTNNTSSSLVSSNRKGNDQTRLIAAYHDGQPQIRRLDDGLTNNSRFASDERMLRPFSVSGSTRSSHNDIGSHNGRVISGTADVPLLEDR